MDGPEISAEMSDPKCEVTQPPSVTVVEPRRELPRLKVEAPVADDDDEDDEADTPTALPLLLPPGFLQVKHRTRRLFSIKSQSHLAEIKMFVRPTSFIIRLW